MMALTKLPNKSGTWLTRLVLLSSIVVAFAATGFAAADSGQPSSWAVEHTPYIPWLIGEFNGVSCVSAGDCIAVGDYNGHGLVERWDGAKWAILAEPNLQGGQLNAVSCVSATLCTAVGVVPSGRTEPIIGTLDGTRWSTVPSPRPSGRWDTGTLQSVSCVSAKSCVAVGQLGGGGGHSLPIAAPLIERWNGSRWWVTPSPSTPGFGGLSGVSCVSASGCTAVGSDGGVVPGTLEPLIEHWNGSSWTIETSPTPPEHGALNSVSCASANSCVAVGQNGTATAPLMERERGSWSIVELSSSLRGKLSGVSCVSASDCVAVGSPTKTSGPPFVELWTGIEPRSLNTPKHSADFFNGVSCVSVATCTVVGADASDLPFSEQST